MPTGPGSYGRKLGRPPVKNKRKRSKVGQLKKGRGLDKSMVTKQEWKALRRAAGIKRKPRNRSAY